MSARGFESAGGVVRGGRSAVPPRISADSAAESDNPAELRSDPSGVRRKTAADGGTPPEKMFGGVPPDSAAESTPPIIVPGGVRTLYN